jgi:hypothetical protein
MPIGNVERGGIGRSACTTCSESRGVAPCFVYCRCPAWLLVLLVVVLSRSCWLVWFQWLFWTAPPAAVAAVAVALRGFNPQQRFSKTEQVT